MFYIGSHWGHVNDYYVCSSKRMKHAYRKRPHDFTRRILHVTTNRSELQDIETSWLKLIKPEEFTTRYYNVTVTGICRDFSHINKGVPQKQWVIEKRRKALTGRTRSAYERERIAASRRNKPLTANQMAAKLANCTPIEVDGVVFESNSAAARHFKVSNQTVANRLKSTKFPEWKIA